MDDPQQEEHILSETIRDYHHQRIREIRKKIRQTRNAIFITAGLLLVSDLLRMAMAGAFSLEEILVSLILSCLFVLLGVLTEKYPFAAILGALVLFGSLWLFQVIFINPEYLVNGILFKGVILYFLATGLGHAREARDRRKELESS